MRRHFYEIVNICILTRLNLMFQACVTKPRLLLIMEPEYRLESAVRGYYVYQTVWDTVVIETLPCVAETNKLKFNCTLIWRIFQFRQTFSFANKTHCMVCQVASHALVCSECTTSEHTSKCSEYKI